MMISQDDDRRTLEFDDYYVIQPVEQDGWEPEAVRMLEGSTPCAKDFEYRSDNNKQWLSSEGLNMLVKQITD
jgi:UDP-N-acetylglucosamine 4,6-dehydratase